MRYRLEWMVCASIAWTVPRLPRSVCIQFAEALGSLAYHLDSRGRNVALANLECAFKDRYTPEEREEIAKKSYRNFGRTFLDLFWAQRINQDNWREYLTVEGDLETIERMKDVQGGVGLCIHWGNFELASLALGFLGQGATIVTETFKNPLLGPVFTNAREAAGHTIIPQENAMLKMLRIVKKKGRVGLLIDLTFPPSQATVAIDTFGGKMCVTFLHSVLAMRGDAALVPLHGEPQPDGRCRAIVDTPIVVPEGSTPQQIAQLCWNHFEPRILEKPELWMWAYKHWRYRPADAKPEDYPFYSNVSSKFDKLLKRQAAEAAMKG